MANVLPKDQQIDIIGRLAEGSSMRAISRMTGVHQDTVCRLGVRIGQGCAKVLDAKKPQMPPDLRASYEAHWSSLIFETRRVRNDAGHPASIDPIAYEEVHGVLLTVPITAHFALQLGEWIGAALR